VTVRTPLGTSGLSAIAVMGQSATEGIRDVTHNNAPAGSGEGQQMRFARQTTRNSDIDHPGYATISDGQRR